MTRVSVVSSIKKAWFVGVIFIVLVAAAISILILYSRKIDTEIKLRHDTLTSFITSVDKQLAINKVKREVALRLKQEAAAHQAADQSLSSDRVLAESIDSKSCNLAKNHTNAGSIDVIVNKKHCIQPVTYAPNNLVTTHGATLSAQAAEAFNALFMAATAAGYSFTVTSSYRSYDDQYATYMDWMAREGKESADIHSARPGYSEHQTGLAFDVSVGNCYLSCFASTGAYQWFQQHSADYGFIQRYYLGDEAITGYGAEEWHYRYIGVAVAKDMKAKNIRTLEQYWGVSGGDYF